MVVYAWAAFLVLFYAANLPFWLVVDVDTRREGFVRVGVGVFAPPRSLSVPSLKRPPHGAAHPDAAAFRAVLTLLRHIRFRGSLDLCAGDAALTALISGAVMALSLGRVRAIPDFSCGPIRVRFHGMVTVKPGHIMLAALVWAQEEISGRINTWKGMRSRAL